MSSETKLPRIGVPYRTRKEELTDTHDQIDKYLNAVRLTGAEPVAVSLGLSPADLAALAATLDAIVLSGSPADIDPSLFHAAKHPECAPPDADRERTDFALLEHAFAQHKPLLAICYGIQSMNVFLGGTLVQDIPTEVGTTIQHDWEDARGDPETFHSAHIKGDSRLAKLAGATDVRVNSSHHQSILGLGRNLRIVSRAPDGVVEAVEWTGDTNWVTGVQWHPERMVEYDSLAQVLFRTLAAAAETQKNIVRV
jgi:putative glutamine amidotransferase